MTAGVIVRDRNTIGGGTVVATVNGVPIAYGEYSMSVSSVRAGVISSFLAKGADQGDPNFWTAAVDGQSPLDALKKAALDGAVHNKLIQILGQQDGLVADISYRAMQDAMKQENQRRADAVQSGQPIYGPQSYTDQVYYDLQISDLESQIQKKAQQDATFTDDQLMKVFNEQYANTPTSPGTITISKLSAAFNAGGGQSKDAARAVMDGICAKIQAGADFDSAAQGADGVTEAEQTLDLNRGAGDDAQRASISEAQYMAVGDVSGVYEDNGSYSILKVTDKSAVTYYTFDQVKDVIASQLAGDAYKQTLQDMTDGADVETTKAYDLMDKLLTSGN
ncbi:MAG: peptidyl-prolyl cis-trans isomerase [Defluviitaleaceae bacterium]|nr:peptidyl-prolyl cis-trans isomerase [Defluviitaleaceae bacterium]